MCVGSLCLHVALGLASTMLPITPIPPMPLVAALISPHQPWAPVLRPTIRNADQTRQLDMPITPQLDQSCCCAATKRTRHTTVPRLTLPVASAGTVSLWLLNALTATGTFLTGFCGCDEIFCLQPTAATAQSFIPSHGVPDNQWKLTSCRSLPGYTVSPLPQRTTDLPSTLFARPQIAKQWAA